MHKVSEERATLTPQDIQRLTGWSLPTVYALLESGKLPGFRIGRRWAVASSRFYSWLDQQAN